MHSITAGPWLAGAVHRKATWGLASATASASVGKVRMPNSISTCARRSAERFTPTISDTHGIACIRRMRRLPMEPNPMTTAFILYGSAK